MPRWPKDATEFPVGVVPNVRLNTSYSYIPKPVLAKLGNPKGIKFVFRGNDIMVQRRD